MAQTSILGRVSQLVRANINALLDDAEDPERMLDQLVRDFTNNIAEAERELATLSRRSIISTYAEIAIVGQLFVLASAWLSERSASIKVAPSGTARRCPVTSES